MRRHGEGISFGLCSSTLEEMLANPQVTFVVHRKLVRIIAELKPLSEQHVILKFLKNVDHSKILNDFVQDLAYAVTDYQVGYTRSIASAF